MSICTKMWNFTYCTCMCFFCPNVIFFFFPLSRLSFSILLFFHCYPAIASPSILIALSSLPYRERKTSMERRKKNPFLWLWLCTNVWMFGSHAGSPAERAPFERGSRRDIGPIPFHTNTNSKTCGLLGEERRRNFLL